MDKKLILIGSLIIICGLIYGQGPTNITWDDESGVDKAAMIVNTKKFTYVLVNLGLAIGAIPTAKRLFTAEPNAWKGVSVWLGGILAANLLIDPIVQAFSAGLK